MGIRKCLFILMVGFSSGWDGDGHGMEGVRGRGCGWDESIRYVMK